MPKGDLTAYPPAKGLSGDAVWHDMQSAALATYSPVLEGAAAGTPAPRVPLAAAEASFAALADERPDHPTAPARTSTQIPICLGILLAPRMSCEKHAGRSA